MDYDRIDVCNSCGQEPKRCHSSIRLISLEGRVMHSRQEIICHACSSMFNSLRENMEDFDSKQHAARVLQDVQCDCWLVPIMTDEEEN